MKSHGLSDWTFQWDGARKRHGQCVYKIKALSFSKFLTEHAEEEAFMSVVMHEIAHALVGPGHGHGVAWRRKMLELGQSPKRTVAGNEAQTEARKATANYVVTCSVTGRVIAHLDRLVKSRRTQRGTVVYKGHMCNCHKEFVLYNGKEFQNA